MLRHVPDSGIRAGLRHLDCVRGWIEKPGAPLLQNRNAEVKKNTGESVISPDSNPSLFSL